MKKILLLTTISGLALVGCSSSQINMSMGNMRLITSSAAPQDVMNFANAACAIKHTILGDINYCSAEDIEEVMNGNSGGRIKR